ncbi:hypothetical protein [Psychrobacter sp. GP33]|uniref:hypothetical protein n=1 Tax=Psychrobacter sp. GP33 TaxID=2758709 RepID=UPI0015FCE578|nr:hypothetical protein [Psychrobacter sp. GP33]
MATRTKFSKFRSLYEVIEGLLDTYTHEGVVEILAESHDLDLSVSTLRSYLYRYKKRLKVLSVATEDSSRQVEIKQKAVKQIVVDLRGSDPIQEDDTDSEDDSDKALTAEELQAALDEMKRQVEAERK